jgi:cysteinyl-tRNA synthetase
MHRRSVMEWTVRGKDMEDGSKGLTLYNTLTRSKEAFSPLDPAHVRMYVCGPTVYDFAHIGNARPVIVFDLLFRLLRHRYGAEHVTYVRNITDVDDKINARAARDYPDLPLNEAIAKVTAATEAQFHRDIAALGVLPPTEEPRATAHIPEMRALIERLVARGVAYVGEEHVLFSVEAMGRQPGQPRYGALARRSLDEMLAGARVDVAPYKRDPMDFVLWKPSKPGEPAWESPAGIATPGRPGWHIECSAMSMAKLLAPFGGGLSCDDPAKNTFDIHGGGIDLVFPHHENEIAQSCCALGTPVMAQVWMHNGFLMVEGEKMSKSLGNFVTIHELLHEWPGLVVRHAMLQTHYRQPINWTRARLEESRTEIGDWAAYFSGSEAEQDYWERKYQGLPPAPSPELLAALSDDLNTPAAMAVLRKQFSQREANGLSKQFFQDCEFLGLLDAEIIGALIGTHVSGSIRPDLLSQSMSHVLRLRAAIANNLPEQNEFEKRALRAIGVDVQLTGGGYVTLVPADRSAELDIGRIEALIAARAAARAAKNWAESDRLRDELAAMGVQLKDGKDPATGQPVTTWEMKR